MNSHRKRSYSGRRLHPIGVGVVGGGVGFTPTSPDQVGTLSVRFNPSALTFSDWGATTPITSGTLLRWTDEVASRYMIDASGAADTTLVTDNSRKYVSFGGKDSGLFGQNNWNGIVGDNVTFGMLTRSNRYDIDGLFDSASGTAKTFRANAGKFDWFSQDPTTPVVLVTPGRDTALVVRLSLAPGRRVEVWLDGTKVVDATSATTTGDAWVDNSPPSVGGINGGGNGRYDGLVGEAVWYNALLTDGKVDELGRYLRSIAKTFTTPVAVTARVIVLGNSFGAGVGTAYGATQGYAGQLAAAHPEWDVRTVAYPSETTAQLTARIPSEVAPLCGGPLPTAVFFQEGINSMFFGRTAAQTYSDIQAATAAIRLLGVPVAVAYPTPRSEVGTPVDYETQRQGLIALMVADAMTHWDADVRWDQVSGMGAAGDELGANYVNPHPNQQGYRRLWPVLATAVGSLV